MKPLAPESFCPFCGKPLEVCIEFDSVTDPRSCCLGEIFVDEHASCLFCKDCDADFDIDWSKVDQGALVENEMENRYDYDQF